MSELNPIADPTNQSLPAPRLSVVLSFRNEEEVLPEAINRLRTVLGKETILGNLSGFELVFVNDDSRDRSLEVLKAAAVGHDDIRVINMSRNFGVSPCVLAGLDYVSGDLAVYIDADMQDPPELIPEMLRAQREAKADVVHTVRRSRAGESWAKLAMTRVGYHILKWVSDVPLRVEAGDFKLLSRRVVVELRKLQEKKPYMRGLVVWVGFKQVEVFYDRLPRAGGVTKFATGGVRVIRNFLESALISFSDVPLHLATIVGAFISCLSFLGMIYVFINKLLGNNAPGSTGVLLAVLFIGGVQILFMGLIGLYIHTIFLESKHRPNYIVESTFGFPEKEADKLLGHNVASENIPKAR